MKKRSKIALVLLSAVLLVVGSVFGTMAYLTSQDTVTNTFTVGKVLITLDEAETNEYGEPVTPAARVDHNEYKLIPGHTYIKDPTIHVDEKSETCWIFAKIENGLGADGTLNINGDNWTLVTGETNVYKYKGTVAAGGNVPVFSQFTFAGAADPIDYETEAKGTVIKVTGYAVQADGFDNADDAWTAAKANFQ